MSSTPASVDDQLASAIKQTILSTEFFDSLQQSLASSPLITELCHQITPSDVFIKLFTSTVSSKLIEQQHLIEHLQKTIDDLDESVADLEEQVDKLELKYNELEQYNQRKNLIICGIPATQNESTDKIAVEIAKITGHSLDTKFIYSSHRLPSKTNNSVRPIVVSFLRYSDRRAIIKNRRKLRENQRYKNVFINEHLTPRNNGLFQCVRQKLNKRSVYTRNGNIFYVDSFNQKHRITSTVIIDNLAQTALCQ
ncbi:unnamed protein product [Didymodactylos carnosus]|nr:unnamed protein product [Didymodactylos carnosus]CAF4464410.1 unnamed protein product [Didymodactylos carnosus]